MPGKRRPSAPWAYQHCVEIFLFLLALLPAVYIAFSNPNTILDWYSSDDGFYYFQVARNLAAGHGFTFDGLNPTNGFHPLWLFLITPLFLFAQLDLLLPLRLLLILSALLSAGSAIMLYRLLRFYISSWVAALVGVLWIVVPRIHDLNMHTGTEAGLNAFCILLFWFLLVTFAADKDAGRTLRRVLWLSLAGALAVLARLDNAFLVSIGGLWLWLRLWQPSHKVHDSIWTWRLSLGAAFAGLLAAILLIYVAWNVLAFGTATPISGQVKLWWGTLRNTVYGFPVNSLTDLVGQFVTDHHELGPWSLATAPFYAAAEWLLTLFGQAAAVELRRWVLLALGAVLVAFIGSLIWAQRKLISRGARAIGLLPFFLACLVHIVYYKVSGSVAQQPWYWIAEVILLLIAFGLLLEALLRIAVSLVPQLKSVASAAGLLTFAALVVVFIAFIQSAVRAPGDGSNSFYLARARWLEAYTEPGAHIAITGAGNLAYFSQDRVIVNMDGLMNTVDYLHALKAGQGAAYLADLGVDYIFGNEYILTQTNPYEPMLAGHLQPYAVYTFADRQLPLWRYIP